MKISMKLFFTNTWQFSLVFHPLQIIFVHYKSRVATAIRGLKGLSLNLHSICSEHGEVDYK